MNRTILIVDDDEVERNILRHLLDDTYNIVEAENGKAAIDLLVKKFRSISAVILDVVMPEMDGFKALEAIKSNALLMPIPVIIATSLNDEESREKAIAYGADNYVSKPYNSVLLTHVIKNAIRLHESAAIANTLLRDSLTGLLNRESFFKESKRMLKRHGNGYFIMSCFDVENFKVINDQYGTEKGDEVLRHIANCLSGFVAGMNGLSCRHNADRFAVLYPANMKDSSKIKQNHELIMNPDCINRTIRIRIGRYLINDVTIPVSAMYDRASMAEESIKGKYGNYIADFNESMRDNLLREQYIINCMESAIENGEFEPWLQPQYNHATGAIIGAEALVRWNKNGSFISPAEFIPVFERNGFVYKMDQYIWDQVCRLLRKWLDDGKDPLPVSVNISRCDLQHKHFISTITKIIDKYSCHTI